MCSGGMTSLLRSRHLRIAGMAVGAVAVAGAAVVVTASAAVLSFGLRQPSQPQSAGANLTAAPPNSSSAACTDLMSHYAAELRKAEAPINTAVQQPSADTP